MQCPQVPPAVVTSMFSLIRKKYYIWPKPYSNVAKDVLQMLSIENMCPGHHLRARFLRQHPAILSKPQNGKERVVHVLLDRGVSKVPAVKQLLQCFDDSTPVSQAELQATLINNILSQALTLALLITMSAFLVYVSVYCYFHSLAFLDT